jgi:hypothetical protein
MTLSVTIGWLLPLEIEAVGDACWLAKISFTLFM